MAKSKKVETIAELNRKARPVTLKLREDAKVDPVLLEIIADIIDGKKKITKEKLDTDPELKSLYQKVATIAMQNLILDDRDKFEEKTWHLFTEDTKRGLWDINHNKILCAISNLTSENNIFPTRSDLSAETKLSRVTINRHLKNYYQSPEHQERQEDFVLMRERVLATAFKYAKTGDMKAAKVFLDATASQQPATTIKNQQNNFIQINGTTITEAQLKELPVDQQLQLQQILNAVNNPKQIMTSDNGNSN